jgi:hypothetical protein
MQMNDKYNECKDEGRLLAEINMQKKAKRPR